MGERSKLSSSKLYKYDKEIVKDTELTIVGIDEAGRGPLAGPVVAAAVCLDLSKPIKGINDSKKLKAAQREQLYTEITTYAKAWSVSSATPEEIDKYNILQATFMAMRRALEGISHAWDLALIDGNQQLPYVNKSQQKTVVEGDALSASIAAASIIAKVTRDRMMAEYHEKFPIYDFQSNKGYGTAYHRSSIENNGICEIHRKTFCINLIMQTRLPL